MIFGQKVVGIILARSGSKGLPNKNILPMGSKPLIYYSIDAALKSAYVDDCILSTDSQKIALIARQLGAEVPFIRPQKLATDTATSVDSVLHALSFLEKRGRQYDLVVLLEPTSPLRESSDIDRSLELMHQLKADAVVSVACAITSHPAYAYTRSDSGRISPFIAEGSKHLRRQELGEVFFPEGTVYISRVKTLRARKSFYHDDTVGYVVPKWKSFEIDDAEDLHIVAAIMEQRSLLR